MGRAFSYKRGAPVHPRSGNKPHPSRSPCHHLPDPARKFSPTLPRSGVRVSPTLPWRWDFRPKLAGASQPGARTAPWPLRSSHSFNSLHPPPVRTWGLFWKTQEVKRKLRPSRADVTCGDKHGHTLYSVSAAHTSIFGMDSNLRRQASPAARRASHPACFAPGRARCARPAFGLRFMV